MALGFKDGELKLIQANPNLLLQNPPKSYLREMLSQWLQWAPGDPRGSDYCANIDKLKEALMGQNLAQLAKEFDT